MKTHLSILTVMAIVTGFSTGCAKDDDSTVALSFSDYTVAERGPGGAKSKPNPLLAERPVFWKSIEALFDLMAPPAQAAVSEVRMCMKRLRFKMAGAHTSADPTQDEDNIDLALGLVTLSTTGTSLGSVSLPKGTYGRVEFDLEDGCDSGYSLYADNAGVYQAQERITIRFEGNFEAAGGEQRLALSVQNIVDGLSGVTDSSQLKNAAENAGGRF